MTSGVMLKLKDINNNVDIEITINKIIELLNSQLIYSYALIDRRFVDLVLLLKTWNKKKFKNPQSRLNSYSIVLMSIAMLQ